MKTLRDSSAGSPAQAPKQGRQRALVLAGWLCVSVAAAAPVPPRPATAPVAPPAATNLESFGKISDRNIFNANRFVTVRRVEEPTRATRAPVIVESFSLLGTLESAKGPVAFFEGSSPSHRKAAKLDESIAGCKITSIEPSRIQLEANGKPLELRVGYMLHRENEGEWRMREAERPSDYGSSFTTTSSSSSGMGAFTGSSSSYSRDSRYSSSRDRDSRYSSSSRDSRYGSSSSSNETPAESAQRRIRDQDRNGDGKISREEADSRLRPNFDLMDRNRDNIVDAEEYTAYYASRMSGGTTSGNPSASSPSTFSPGGSSSSSFNTPATTPPSPSSSPGTSSAPGTSSGESDILRRLMEQRARENR
jgi:hypothetical protein